MLGLLFSILPFFIPILILIAIFKYGLRDQYPGLLRSAIGIYVIFCVLVFFGAVHIPGTGISKTDMTKWTMQEGGYDYQFVGTGVFINPATVITSLQTLKGCRAIGVRSNDVFYRAAPITTTDTEGIAFDKSLTDMVKAFTKNAVVVGGDPSQIVFDSSQLAAIQTNANVTSPAVFRQAALEVGQKIISIDYSATPGEFGHESSTLLTNDKHITYKPIAVNNDSGAPLYDENGYLMGIHLNNMNASRFNPFDRGHGTGRHGYYVAKFLQDNNIAFTMAPKPEQSLTGTDAFEKNKAVAIMCVK